ncbi:lipid II flippase MurJ [Kitasatospora sp. NPDC101801]|uniref:lipid II flippase MurJ n=1 Tax=Kitasatospora sp. NPDC101801 TaxID=3364103 RepID=UPI0038261942
MSTDQHVAAVGAAAPPAPPAPRRDFLAKAFGVTALLTAAGSAFGLLRDLLLARYFGANQGTDAFLVAWTVPETAAPLLIEDAMAFLMVPAFSLALVLREERPKGPDPVRQLVRATLPWLLLTLCGLSVLTAVGAPQLVRFLAPGLVDPALAVTCTRITALTILPFGIAGYLGSALRAHHSFTAPAGIYVAYNLAILGVLLVGHTALGVRSAAIGVAVGSLLMAGVLVGPFLRRLRVSRRRPRKSSRGGPAGLVLIPLAILPVAGFTLTRQSQVFIERHLGSGLPPGTISHLNYAAKVSQLAMTAAILICTVTFPLVARALAAGDLRTARDRVEKDIGQATALVLVGTAFLMACAPSVVALLFERGAFTPHDTAATAAVIRVYSFGLPAQALIGVMVRPYFSVRPVVRRADEDPASFRVTRLDWYPVAAMAIGLLVTVTVGLAATPHFGGLGLAAGNAAGITTTAGLLLRGLLLRGLAIRVPKVITGQSRLLAAAVGAAAVGYLADGLTASPLPATLAGGVTVLLVFAALGAAFGAAEIREPLLAGLARFGPGPRTRAEPAGPAPTPPAPTPHLRPLKGNRSMDVDSAQQLRLPAQATAGRTKRPAGSGRSAPWILMYHSVADEEDDPYLLTVSPERFAAQMGWLHRTGRRGVSVRELLRARAEGTAGQLVGLTFDDGYADFARHAVPVLHEYGFTATAYVVPDLLGTENGWDVEGPRKQLLTLDQVTELARAGWEIGSHGLGHQALPGLPAADLAAQTGESRRALEELIGGPVTGFCYPYGAVDLAAARAVRDAGYDYACAIAHGGLTGRYALPRSYVGDRDGALRLRAKRGRHRVRDLLTAVRAHRPRRIGR